MSYDKDLKISKKTVSRINLDYIGQRANGSTGLLNSEWILYTGFWNDNGKWLDGSSWND